jgi:intracellular septation protein A
VIPASRKRVVRIPAGRTLFSASLPGAHEVVLNRPVAAVLQDPRLRGMFEPLDLASWTEFFFTIAAASATLIGLIVVGLSIHADFIAQSLTHRSHARATLVVLTATVVIGVAALVPQPPEWAGWEFGLITIGFASINTYNNTKALRQASWRLPAAAWRRMAIGYAIAAFGLIGAGSIVALGGQGGGLYWIGLETIGGLVWAIAGAWRFLIGVADEQRPPARTDTDESG